MLNIKHMTFTDKNIANNYIFITLYMIDSCNYSCSYCYNKQPRTFQQININNVKKFILSILDIHKDKTIKLEILGGEPTLHPELYSFCEYFSKFKNVIMYIYSNFSNNLKLYIKLLQLKNVYFDLSHHYINNKINYEFFKKLKKLIEITLLHNKININYMLMPNIKVPIILFDIIKKYNITIEFRILQDTVVYNDQYINYINSEIVKNDNDKIFKATLDNDKIEYLTLAYLDMLNYNFAGFKCKAGSKCLYVHCNGNVYPCQMYYEDQIPNSIICNINNDYNISNIITNKYIICKTKRCGCNYGIEKYIE